MKWGICYSHASEVEGELKVEQRVKLLSCDDKVMSLIRENNLWQKYNIV